MRALYHAGLKTLLTRRGVRLALTTLDAPGEETRLVGGCVRDALLGAQAADLDLATTLLPDAVIALGTAACLKPVPTGIAHGTVTLVTADGPVEVTTLREDIATDGRHAVVRFGRDFSRDAERRDFTLNALSLTADGSLHDTVGGLEDLAGGRVRFIGDPATRIREDALRILRFFRFHARFGEGPPDGPALAACVAARDALDGLSRERVRAEFFKLLAAPGASGMVATLSSTGLLQRITGGVAEHGRLRRAAAAGLAPVMRLAALAVTTIGDADRLHERLRLSKAEHGVLSDYAGALAGVHGAASVGAAAMRALVAEHGLPLVPDVLAILSGEPRPAVREDAWAVLDAMRRTGRVPEFPIQGADLVAAGIPPGPSIGIGLAAARRLWLDRGCPDVAEARGALLAEALASARATAHRAGPHDVDSGL